MIFGMTFWQFVWLSVKVIVAISIGVWLFEILFAFVVAYGLIFFDWLKDKFRK